MGGDVTWVAFLSHILSCFVDKMRFYGVTCKSVWIA